MQHSVFKVSTKNKNKTKKWEGGVENREDSHFATHIKVVGYCIVPSVRSSMAFLTPLSNARASAGLRKVSPNFRLSTFQW